MKKLFLSLALLVPSLAFGALTLETSFQVCMNDQSRVIDQTIVVEEGEYVRCTHDAVTIGMVAQTQEDGSVLVKAEIFHNDILVSAPELKCELDTPARIECASNSKGESSYSFTITAHKA